MGFRDRHAIEIHQRVRADDHRVRPLPCDRNGLPPGVFHGQVLAGQGLIVGFIDSRHDDVKHVSRLLHQFHTPRRTGSKHERNGGLHAFKKFLLLLLLSILKLQRTQP
jgi:hypothetical protein